MTPQDRAGEAIAGAPELASLVAEIRAAAGGEASLRARHAASVEPEGPDRDRRF